MLDYENAPESVIIRDKNDLKIKLQHGLDDIKLNKLYSLDESMPKFLQYGNITYGVCFFKNI